MPELSEDEFRALLVKKLTNARLVTAKPRTNGLAAEIAVREVWPLIQDRYREREHV